ncbi:MAG: hypothetical protein KF729_02380 [Sandaracinaceae bacterium]|nr:hypothetical protein [Sandaracinaceae bacterium]
MLNLRRPALFALLALVGASTPVGACAQEPSDATAAPSSEPLLPEAPPSEALTVPQGAVVAPQGYGDLTVPVLRPRPTGRRATLYALSVGSARPLTLHARRTDGGEDVRCAAPCRLDVDYGRYVLSVQPRGGGPRAADDMPVWLEGDRLAVTMSYDNRGALRALGWAFFSGALTAFSLSWIGGIFAAVLIGTPIAAALLIPFLPLVFLNDSARVEVTPLPE